MATSDHLIPIECPNCKVNLFRATGADGGEIAFCSICGAGGDFEQVVVKRGNLIGGFVAPPQVEEFLRKIRTGG